MTKHKSFILKTIQYYLVFGLIEAVVSLVYLISIPTDPKNVWIFGISKNRFVMSIGIVLVIVWFLISTLITYRKQDSIWLENFIAWLEKWIKMYRWYIPFIFLAFGIVVFGPYFYLLKNSINLPTLQAILIRISPIFFLGCSLTLQTVVALIVLNYHLKPWISSQTEDKIIVAIRPRKVMIILLTLGLLLVPASLSMDVTEQIIWQRIVFFGEKFDLDHEYNIPTGFSSLLLLISSALSWLIAKHNSLGENTNLYKNHWMGLSVLFLFLALDEVAVLHENLGDLLIKVKLFEREWILLALPFLLIFVVFYMRFFLLLPKEIKNMLFLAAILYVGGAVGVELLNGWYEDVYDVYNDDKLAGLQVLTTIEESLEMAGIMVYIYALLKYMSVNNSEIVFRVKSKARRKQYKEIQKVELNSKKTPEKSRTG